jgi:hypothetical protein
MGWPHSPLVVLAWVVCGVPGRAQAQDGVPRKALRIVVSIVKTEVHCWRLIFQADGPKVDCAWTG